MGGRAEDQGDHPSELERASVLRRSRGLPGMKCRKGNPGRDRWESRAQWMQRRGERLVRLLVGLCVCVCVCVCVRQ